MTQIELREALHYDPESGIFTRVTGRCGGSIAGRVRQDGYRTIKIRGRFYQAHRLAFLYVLGTLPDGEVDHINGNRDDNRWSNLRAVSHAENQRNSGLPSNNTSGCRGVSMDRSSGKWRVQIGGGPTRENVGLFNTIAEAIHARKLAEAKYGYSRQHGERRRRYPTRLTDQARAT